MGKGGKGHSCERRRRRQQLACAACTVILVILIIILAVLYFAVYRPKDPRVQVPVMQLLALYPVSSFTAGSTSQATYANVTLNLQISIYNPNRATFIVQDGGVACLFYYGTQVGFAPIPTGSIPAQSSSTISEVVTVQGNAPLQGANLLADISSGILHVSTSVTVQGRVTTLNLFTHHALVVSKCDVSISLSARGIVSYTCQRSYSLDP